MASNSTAAVVVTFNRKILLCECLEALLRQSKKIDAIFVVDNASSDGTKDLLIELGYLSRPSIRYLPLFENLGGAGGFHAGMLAAYEAGYDWIWLMDDDTEPCLDSLEKMEIYKKYTPVVAIANQKVDKQGNVTEDGLRLFSGTKLINKMYISVRFSSFVGLLVSRLAISKIGFPRPEFFIHRDDTEYCLRLHSIGEIALATDGIVLHKEAAREQSRKKIFSYYFYQEDIVKFCFGYFKHRNTAWVQQHYCKNLFIRYGGLLARFVCFSAAVMAFDRDHRWLRIKILAKANLDGLRGNFDNSFPWRLQNTLKQRVSMKG